MAITSHPVIGYENQLRRSTAVLSSADDTDANYPLTNMASGNLGVVSALTSTTSNAFVLDIGVADQEVGVVFLRFRENWEDITSIRVEGDTENTFTSPPFDTTYTNLFPASDEWEIGMPRRPVFRAVFTNVAYQYWRVTITRTTGTNDLTIGACYIGPNVQLSTTVEGIAVFGQSVMVDAATEELTADIDTDFRFARSQRRSTQIKLMGAPSDVARAKWFKKLMFAARNADIFYSYNPTETDPALIHAETLWGLGQIDSFTFASLNNWEGTLTIRERL